MKIFYTLPSIVAFGVFIAVVEAVVGMVVAVVTFLWETTAFGKENRKICIIAVLLFENLYTLFGRVISRFQPRGVVHNPFSYGVIIKL